MDPNEPTRSRVERAQREVARLRVDLAELALARSSRRVLSIRISTAFATAAVAFCGSFLLAGMVATDDAHAEEVRASARHGSEMGTLARETNTCIADRASLLARVTHCEEDLLRSSADSAGAAR